MTPVSDFELFVVVQLWTQCAGLPLTRQHLAHLGLLPDTVRSMDRIRMQRRMQKGNLSYGLLQQCC